MDALDPDSPAPAAVPIDLAAPYRPADRYGWLAAPGARLRYACWNATGTARGTVVLLTGRAEFIEKYATEIVGELLGRGYAVIALDWRGQGLSDRPLPQEHDAGHIDRFETYAADLKLFLDTIVAPLARGRVIALAHSMGGHILLRGLAEQGCRPFDAAVVTSAMTGLQREAFLRSILMLLPEVPAIEHRYLFGTGPFIFLARDFAANHVTHDERRYRWTEAWFGADRRLSLGGPTVGWARQAARSMSAGLAPGTLERIDIPVLLMTAVQDQVINPASHDPVVARIPQARHVTFADARHEIMMELDPIRARFWAAFDGFVVPLLG
jgi:lysophospholipase